MVVLGSATWMRVTGMTRVWPVDELVMETEATAWGSKALTIYFKKLGKPWDTSLS
jgi:hypothetical protein